MSDWKEQLSGVNTKQSKQERPKQTGANLGIAKTMGGFGIRRLISDNYNGGEVFENFMSVFEEALEAVKKEAPSTNFTLHRIMKQDHDLNYSGIALANTAGNTTIYHVLVFEATGDNPHPLVRDYGGEAYTIVRTPAEALDRKYMSEVESAISISLGVPRESVRSVDGTLVPREFNATDKLAIERVVSNTVNAIYAETLVIVEDFIGEALSSFNSHKDARFALDVNFSNDKDMLYDITGSPIRKDITIRLSTKIGNSNMNSINQGNGGEEILRIYGYVDFQYQIPAVSGGYDGHQPMTQCFMPEFVVTHFETDRTLMTPHLLIMGIASLVSISEDQVWVKYFFEQSPVKGKEVNLTDIGMLNIQGNLQQVQTGYGEPVNTTDGSLGPRGLLNFINLLVKPKMMISLDVPSCGPNTWFLSIFKHIFAGSEGARSRISEAINVLIGGGFVDDGRPMFISNSNKIHGGFYIEKGELYDVRRMSSYLGYAAHIHATNQSPTMISRYVSTFQNESIPVEIRAAERGKMISGAVGNRMETKQYYDRLTFSAAWLTPVVEILKSRGFAPMAENIHGGQDIFQQRGVNYDQAGIDPSVRVTGSQDLFSGFNTPYRGYDRTYR